MFNCQKAVIIRCWRRVSGQQTLFNIRWLPPIRILKRPSSVAIRTAGVMACTSCSTPNPFRSNDTVYVMPSICVKDRFRACERRHWDYSKQKGVFSPSVRVYSNSADGRCTLYVVRFSDIAYTKVSSWCTDLGVLQIYVLIYQRTRRRMQSITSCFQSCSYTV